MHGERALIADHARPRIPARTVPFFAIATYAFIYRRPWIRIPTIVYAAHTCTTLLPILADILLGGDAAGARTKKNVPVLFAAYFPYFLVPLVLLVRMWEDERPFSARRREPPPSRKVTLKKGR